MPSSLITHTRYFAQYKSRGTPPRAKTIRKLKAQDALGLTPLRKLAILSTGIVQHPTKRSRTIRCKFNVFGEWNNRKGWGRIEGRVASTGFKAKKRFSEAQRIIQRLTNRERKHLYGMAHDLRKRLSEIPASALRERFDATGERFADIPKGRESDA